MRTQNYLLIVCLLLLLAAACTQQPAAPMPTTTPATPTATPPPPTPKPLPTLPTRLTAAERAEIFTTIWETVNAEFYDPAFGGVDWQAVGAEYRQQLPAVEDDHTFWFQFLNPMLFELGVSHIFALPAELITEMQPEIFATGTLGLDVRLLDGLPVVTWVAEGSPAEQAGLQPGFVITALDGRTLADFQASSFQTPPENERHRRGRSVSQVRTAFYGEAGTDLVIDYLDAQEQPRRASLEFAPRENAACGELDPALPPVCVDLELQRLTDSIAYLRFSAFLQPVLDGVLAAIDDLSDTSALIIDLRGNPGGEFPVRVAIASHLVGEPKLFMRYKLREGVEEAYLDPVPDPYPGVVIILVDELSTSSSEEFTGSLQALGRAAVIGGQTPGSCLVMNLALLPHDAVLSYPYKQSQTPDGRILEDNGVLPDIEVALDRQELLQGIDAQLEAALQYAREQIGE